jgi:hypothetical protein
MKFVSLASLIAAPGALADPAGARPGTTRRTRPQPPVPTTGAYASSNYGPGSNPDELIVRLKTVTDGGETVCHDKVGPDAHGFLCHDYDDIINRLTQMKIGGIGSDQHDTHSREDVTRMICVDNGDHCCACGGGHQEVAAPAADAGDELGSPTVFKSDKCDPKECDNWTCKNWCKCFKAHPEIIEIFEGPNPSTAEQAIRNSCPSDNDECDCTKYHFGNAKKE